MLPSEQFLILINYNYLEYEFSYNLCSDIYFSSIFERWFLFRYAPINLWTSLNIFLISFQNWI